MLIRAKVRWVNDKYLPDLFKRDLVEVVNALGELRIQAEQEEHEQEHTPTTIPNWEVEQMLYQVLGLFSQSRQDEALAVLRRYAKWFEEKYKIRKLVPDHIKVKT